MKRLSTAYLVFFGLLSAALGCHHATEPPPPLSPDTTSHSYNWTTTVLGDWGGSILYDAAIINDTLAYAVGYIYLLDSLGRPENAPHNLARWDGHTWTIERVLVAIDGGFLDTNPLRTIYAFGADDIWIFSDAGSWVHWDGKTWTTQLLAAVTGGGERFWGRSSHDLYLVGTNGSVSHFDGTSWQVQPTTTTTTLTDIAGSADGSVLWAGGVSSDDAHSVLLRCQAGASWELLWQRDGSTTLPPFGFSITSITVIGEKVLFATPTSVYALPAKSTSLEGLELLTSSVPHFPYAVRAAALNDITVVGDRSTIYHYNGFTWQVLYSVGTVQPLYGLAVSRHQILAVGQGNGALIIQGVR